MSEKPPLERFQALIGRASWVIWLSGGYQGRTATAASADDCDIAEVLPNLTHAECDCSPAEAPVLRPRSRYSQTLVARWRWRRIIRGLGGRDVVAPPPPVVCVLALVIEPLLT